MNPILAVIKEALKLLGRLLPESIRPFLGWVVELLDGVNLPAGDPRINQIAEIVTQLMIDIQELDAITDVTAKERARLILENRFGRAWIALSMGGGV